VKENKTDALDILGRGRGGKIYGVKTGLLIRSHGKVSRMAKGELKRGISVTAKWRNKETGRKTKTSGRAPLGRTLVSERRPEAAK